MKGSRPIGRILCCLALLLLGGVAVGRLHLAFLPTFSLPELNVSLRLPEAGEVGEVTQEWVVPLESAIRAAGEVRSTAGSVDANGGRFQVRFQADIDIERKAARLESELGSLRRRLPAGSILQVWPVGQSAGENAAVIWLPQDLRTMGAENRLLEALRRLPQVRAVEIAGRPQREVRIRHRQPGRDASGLRRAAVRQLSNHPLGVWRREGKGWAVQAAGGRHLPLGEQLIRQEGSTVPLNSMAEVELVAEEPPWLARRNGEAGKVLLVEREVGASPLALTLELRRVLSEQGLGEKAHFLLDEAEPLRSMLMRLAGGLLLATVLSSLSMAVLLGWRAGLVQVLVLPLALAAGLNAFWLAGFDLDLTTVPLLAIALAGGLLFFALRQAGQGAVAAVFTVLAAWSLPVAVALAGGRLAPMLLGPAKAFAVALTACVLVLWIPPLPSLARRPPRFFSHLLKMILRRPWTILLGGVTLTYLCLVLSGKALDPRSGGLAASLLDLGVFLDFAEGSTLEQAEAQVIALEKHLASVPEITDVWCVFGTRGATLGIDLRPQDQRLSQLRPLVRQLQAELSALGSAASVVPYAGGSRRSEEPIQFGDSLEDEARADEEAHSYRYILRGTDLKTLREAHEWHLELLAEMKYNHFVHLVRTEWRQPSVHLELSPRMGVPQMEAQRAVAAVRRRSTLPSPRPLTAMQDLALRVVPLEAPQDLDEVPQRSDLLGLQAARSEGGVAHPLVVADLLELHEQVRSPGLRRQSGRFVLPVNLRLRGTILERRKLNRDHIHRWLGLTRLPPGVELELPEFGRFTWSRERLQLLAIGSALPLLLLALGFIRLNALKGGLAAAWAAVLGVAAACPFILASRGQVDELTLLALGAALTAVLPAALEIAGALRSFFEAPFASGAAYHWVVRRGLTILIAAGAWVALLMVPGLGLDPDRDLWVLPLRVASVVGLMVSLGAVLLLPALLRTRRPPPKEEAKRHQRPPIWYQPGQLEFAVQNLTKVYGNGFHALHRVNFRLEPGIVGLLGPNGAGKTTLLRILCGLLEPSRGQVLFHGVPIESVNLPSYRRLVGFLPQDFNAYEGFTAEQFLNYWALERGLGPKARHREVERLIAQVGLEEAAKRKVRDFSGGMRRRIGIARSLLGDPPILIVDEPTTGLDVESRNRLRESLLSVAGERIIIFSTHIASDVAAAASRILLLHQGRLLYDGVAGGLIEMAQGRVFETLLGDEELREFSHQYRITTRVRTLEGIRVRAVTFGDQEITGELVVPNLEEAYLAMLGEQSGSREDVSRGLGASLLDVEAWRS